MKSLALLFLSLAITFGCTDSTHAYDASKEAAMSPESRWLSLPFNAKDESKLTITEGWTYSAQEQSIHGHTTHFGVDFAAPRGTPVYAAADGVMIGSFHSSYAEALYKGKRVGFGLGNFVQIWHQDAGFFTVYAHLDRHAEGVPFVKPDDMGDGKWNPSIVNKSLEEVLKLAKPVKKGELIGYIGDSGLSLGYDEGPHLKRDPSKSPSWDETHLHFEVYQRDGRGRKSNRKDPYGIYGEASQYKLLGTANDNSLWRLDKGGIEYARWE